MGPLLCKTMDLESLPRMGYWESVAPVDAPRQYILPKDKAESCLLLLDQAKERLSE